MDYFTNLSFSENLVLKNRLVNKKSIILPPAFYRLIKYQKFILIELILLRNKQILIEKSIISFDYHNKSIVMPRRNCIDKNIDN